MDELPNVSEVHQNLRKGYPVFYKAGMNFRSSFLFSSLFTYFILHNIQTNTARPGRCSFFLLENLYIFDYTVYTTNHDARGEKT